MEKEDLATPSGIGSTERKNLVSRTYKLVTAVDWTQLSKKVGDFQ